MQSTKSLKLGILALLFVALIIFSGCGGGTVPYINQYGTAVGFVKDSVTITGIEGATVTIGGKSNITDSNGAYFIENIPVGSQSIVVTALSYQDYNNSITIEEGDNVIDDVLLEPEVTHYEGTSNSDGIATFILEGDQIVRVKVIDVVTGEPIANINSYLVTDGTDVAFLLVDKAGIYIPRIAPEEQSRESLVRNSEERLIGTIKELWKMGSALLSGYEPRFADQIENRLASYMFRTFFVFCFPTTLGEIKTNLLEFFIEDISGDILDTAICALAGIVAVNSVPVVGQVLAIIGVIELGNTLAYELWAIHYTSRGYSLYQMFEVWRLNPFLVPGAMVVPFVFPIEEPSYPVPEENPGSISGKVLDALTAEGIYNAKVQIVDLNLSTTTNSDGSYYFNSVSPGTYGIVATKAGYYPSVQINVTVISEATAVDVNLVLSSILASTEYRIVLTWGENPRDLDSHLWIPNGEHCYYANKTVSGANLDVDDRYSYGPETITITNISSGTYTYAVKHYAGTGKITTSGAKVEVYNDSGKIRTYEVNPNASCGGVGWYWAVFELDGHSGAITTINAFSSSSPRSVNDKELLFEKK